MAEIQEVFHRIHTRKREQKQLRIMFKDALESRLEYRSILEEIERLKVRKREIEMEVRGEISKDWEKLDVVTLHVKQDNELLSDLALNKLLAKESIELKDEYDQVYDPIFVVKFKKANLIAQDPATTSV